MYLIVKNISGKEKFLQRTLSKTTWTTKDKATLFGNHSEAATIAKNLDAKVYDSEKDTLCKIQMPKRKKPHSEKHSQVMISVKNRNIEMLGGKLKVAVLLEKYIESITKVNVLDNRTSAEGFPIGQTPLISE